MAIEMQCWGGTRQGRATRGNDGKADQLQLTKMT
jgi:hypothetical protein